MIKGRGVAIISLDIMLPLGQKWSAVTCAKLMPQKNTWSGAVFPLGKGPLPLSIQEMWQTCDARCETIYTFATSFELASLQDGSAPVCVRYFHARHVWFCGTNWVEVVCNLKNIGPTVAAMSVCQQSAWTNCPQEASAGPSVGFPRLSQLS